MNQYDWVVPSNNLPIYCGPATKTKTPNCPFHTHLGSSIAAMLGLVNLDYNFSQRADVGFRVFTLGDNRDESGALNGIAGNPTCVFSGPGPACAFSPSSSDSPNEVANPVLRRPRRSREARPSLRAYAPTTRIRARRLDPGRSRPISTPTTTTSTSSAERSRRTTSRISTRATTKGFRGAGRSTQSEFAFGGYARQEALSGAGIDETLSQSIDSYFFRGAQQLGNNVRALRRALRRRLFDVRQHAELAARPKRRSWERRASCGSRSAPDFGAPLLFERYFFPPVVVNGKVEPNPGLPPLDSNCVTVNGNPNERPEHATEYELGFSHLFSSTSNLDVSIYRSNLRDTIENYYPGGGAQSFCGTPLGFAYEIPINIGNAVYEGAEARYKQMFPRLNLTATFSYGLNVAYPYALGPFVSNPTSGGTLVDYQQFLGVPQQQGSAVLTWARNGWHASAAFTFAGRNNTLNQPPYTLGRRCDRQELRAHRFHDRRNEHLQCGLRVRSRSTTRAFRIAASTPDRRIRQFLANYSDRRALRRTGCGEVHRYRARMTATMRAVRLHEIGGPENLRIDEIPVPAIRDDEVLVRIRAAALNHRDLFITQGLYPNVRLPVTLGSDGAGRDRGARRGRRGPRRRRRSRDRSDAGVGRRSARLGRGTRDHSRDAARRDVRAVRRRAAGERLSQARASLDGRGRGDSARRIDGLSRDLYARRRAARRDRLDYRSRRRRADLRLALRQARRRASDRHVEQRRKARARRPRSAPTSRSIT